VTLGAPSIKEIMATNDDEDDGFMVMIIAIYYAIFSWGVFFGLIT
jgi:hypothetical protein